MSNLTPDWVDQDFETLDAIATELGGKALDLLSVMYAESGARATALNDNPKTRRGADGKVEFVPPDERYNAAGLIQFMPFILVNMSFGRDLGPRARAEAFTRVSVGGQLPYVRRYYLPHAGRLTNATAWYLATFLPALLRHADEPDYVLADKERGGFSGSVYVANSAFDADGDRRIQVRELGQAIDRNFVGARAAQLAARLTGSTVPAEATMPPQDDSHDLRTWLGIQTALAKVGYGPGEVDGIYGPKTRAAVVAFQEEHPPLMADGIYGPKTRAALQVALAAALAGGVSAG